MGSQCTQKYQQNSTVLIHLENLCLRFPHSIIVWITAKSNNLSSNLKLTFFVAIYSSFDSISVAKPCIKIILFILLIQKKNHMNLYIVYLHQFPKKLLRQKEMIHYTKIYHQA